MALLVPCFRAKVSRTGSASGDLARTLGGGVEQPRVGLSVPGRLVHRQQSASGLDDFLQPLLTS